MHDQQRKKERKGGRERKIPWKRFRVGNQWRKKVDENVISGELDRPPISAYFSKANGRRQKGISEPRVPYQLSLARLRTNWFLGKRRERNRRRGDYRRWVSVFSFFYCRLKVPCPLIGFESKSAIVGRVVCSLEKFLAIKLEYRVSISRLEYPISISEIWNFLREHSRIFCSQKD